MIFLIFSHCSWSVYNLGKSKPKHIKNLICQTHLCTCECCCFMWILGQIKYKTVFTQDAKTKIPYVGFVFCWILLTCFFHDLTKCIIVLLTFLLTDIPLDYTCISFFLFPNPQSHLTLGLFGRACLFSSLISFPSFKV